MKEVFVVEYDGETFKIEKSSLTFVDGYAVCTIPYETEYDFYGDNIIGIVNEKFETIYPFQQWYTDIQLFAEGNFFESKYATPDGGNVFMKESIHRKIKKVEGKEEIFFIKPLNFSECIKVNNTTNVFIGDGVSVLYNVLLDEYISERLSEIGAFTEVELKDGTKEKRATAVINMCLSEENEVYGKVVCVINEYGEIIESALFDCYSGDKFVFGHGVSFGEIIQRIQRINKEAEKSKHEKRKKFVREKTSDRE